MRKVCLILRRIATTFHVNSYVRDFSVALAIFDLDHTLIDGDSDHAWGQFLVDNQLVNATEYKQKNDWFFEQYQKGELDVHAYLAFALEPLTQFPLEEYINTVSVFYKSASLLLLLKRVAILLLNIKHKVIRC